MREPPDRRAVSLSYDQAARGYDDRHGDARSVRRFRIIDAPQLGIARGAGRVLELGCGTGRLLAQLAAERCVGVDVSMAMLAGARQKGLLVAAADAHVLPFADASFDAILAGKGTFRYLDYGRAFAECARILVPGGKLAVHQYAARTWSPVVLGPWRGRAATSSNRLHVKDLRELYDPAAAAGLVPIRTHLWRSVRMPPYALPIPAWLPGHLWSHCVIIFAKNSSRTRGGERSPVATSLTRHP